MSCAELQVFSCYRGWKEACQVRRAISTTWRRELSSSFFFLQGKAREENLRHSDRNMHHRMPPSKTGWPSLNVLIFSHVMRLVLDDPKQWPPEISDQIHELILEDRRISDKSIGEHWAHQVSGLGPSFMKIWTCGSSPRSGSRNAWTRIKHVNGASLLSNFWNFFGAIQIISCRDWWPWTKSGYITMTRGQSNNQCSGGIVAHPAPKYYE